MYFARISVPLTKFEMDLLVIMSDDDCRPPREQMRYLLRQEAKRRRLLDASNEHLLSLAADEITEEVNNG